MCAICHCLKVHWQKLASQLIRARRGVQTQQQLSRALGYKSNAVFSWENGHDEPSARVFFRLVSLSGEVGDLTPFFKKDECPDLQQRDGIVSFLRGLAEGWKVSELSHAMKRDRHAVGRWLRGQTDISLPSLLHFIHITGEELCDFLAALVDVNELEEAAPAYRRLQAARVAGEKMPWASALLYLARLPSYAQLTQHEPGWFSQRLEISEEQERECLDYFVAQGRLIFEAGRYLPSPERADPLVQDAQTRKSLASFWLERGAAQVRGGSSSVGDVKLVALGPKEWRRAQTLRRDYFRKLDALAEASESVHGVAVTSLQWQSLGVESER